MLNIIIDGAAVGRASLFQAQVLGPFREDCPEQALGRACSDYHCGEGGAPEGCPACDPPPSRGEVRDALLHRAEWLESQYPGVRFMAPASGEPRIAALVREGSMGHLQLESLLSELRLPVGHAREW